MGEQVGIVLFTFSSRLPALPQVENCSCVQQKQCWLLGRIESCLKFSLALHDMKILNFLSVF